MFNMRTEDFPAALVVKNPPANAGDTGFEPQSRKIPCAAGQPSLCATAAEPTCWGLSAATHRGPSVHAPQQEKRRSERPVRATKSSPRSPQLEGACALRGRPSMAKTEAVYTESPWRCRGLGLDLRKLRSHMPWSN